jgi:hypothetical protein
VVGRLIDEHPDFDPRACLAELPKMDAFGALLFPIVGQQLSASSTRPIVTRLQALFGGHLPTPHEFLDVDPDKVRGAGLSSRNVETLRTLARMFADSELDEESLAVSFDAEIEARLTAIPGIGPWTVRGFLLIEMEGVREGSNAVRQSDLAAATSPPVVDQVQFSPFEYRRALLDGAQQRNLVVEAYNSGDRPTHLEPDGAAHRSIHRSYTGAGAAALELAALPCRDSQVDTLRTYRRKRSDIRRHPVQRGHGSARRARPNQWHRSRARTPMVVTRRRFELPRLGAHG